MITNPIEFRHELEKINEWWLTGKVWEKEEYPFKRDIFVKLTEELKSQRAIILLGPRRVGKSVLIKQLIDFLIKNNTDPSSILYYSLDDPSLFTYSDNLLKDIIDYFGENIVKGGRKYVFMDEIHSFPDWHKWIKSYYDRYPNIKFILTGSSSLALQEDANKFLRGRIFEFELFPLNFQEFLGLSNSDIKISIPINTLKDQKILEIERLGLKIKKQFNEYLLVGGFPEWFEVKKQESSIDKWFERLINDIPKKAIYEDIAGLFGVKNPRILELIFTFISSRQSQIISYETINEVAGLDRLTLVNYIEFLKNSYLLVEILKFAKLKEQLKARKKYLVIDQGLRNAILKDYQIREDNVGFVIENLIGLKCFLLGKENRGNVFYWKINGEVDFILKGNNVLPIEVKYRNHISEKEISPLLSFMQKANISEGMIITKDIFKKEHTAKKTLYYVPAWLFLLLKCAE